MRSGYRVSALTMSIAALAACGGTIGGSGGAGDGGRLVEAAADTTVVVDTGSGRDSGRDTGSPLDTGAPSDGGADACSAPTGCVDGGPVPTLLVAGDFVVYGVTRDGFVIYSDYNDTGMPMNVWAVALAGGSPVPITTVGVFPYVSVSGASVLIWPDTITMPANITSLGVWNSTSGYHQVTSTTFFGDAALSSDGTAILYVGNIGNTHETGDLMANTTDFSRPGTTVVSGIAVDPSNSPCLPQLAFAGGTDFGLATYCVSGDAGAGPGATLSSIALGSSWSAMTLLPNAASNVPFSSDAMGQTVFIPDASGNGLLVPIHGGAPRRIDTSVREGAVSPDGSTVVYLTTSTDAMGNTVGAAKQVTTMTPAPVLLYQGTTSANVLGFLPGPPSASYPFPAAFSPDFHWFFSYGLTDSIGIFSDLQLLDTSTASQTPTPLDRQPDAAAYLGWTNDSAYATWYSQETTSGPSQGFGAFHITQLSTKTDVPLPSVGTLSWFNFPLGTSGAMEAYDDNGAPALSGAGEYWLKGTADIEVIDLSTANPTPTKLVAGADVSFWPTADGSKIVYTYSGSLATPGLYVIDTP